MAGRMAGSMADGKMQAGAAEYDVIIVGGGAAGLTAAIAYLRRTDAGRLLVIDANDVCGRKLLATGNGRCNISNLAADGYAEIKDFFESIGVLFRVEEGGRAYPMSGRAVSVQSALVLAAERLGADFALGQRVTEVRAGAADGGFEVKAVDPGAAPGMTGAAPGMTGAANGTTAGAHFYHARRVLIAVGGKAGPQYGCFGEGFGLARKLGHTVESIGPALVPLVYTEAERGRLAGLKGVRVKCKAELMIDGRRAAASSGELLFAEYGLSGVMMFDLSATMPKSILEDRPQVCVHLDLVPGIDAPALGRLMEENPGLWLSGVLDEKLSALLVRENGADSAKVAAAAKDFKARLSGTKGWKEAQTTRGGIPLTEIDGDTGESRVAPGLYFAGEVLEPVFLCGGFNLSNAWATGIRAGASM
ncbi:MAG: NAD(P)/FAD-dependent oxidoreductase [Clostridiales Family XIII bacterium]|jgi:predicted flavoprotein YhiN|nr:NAD(P)/FAD-dependent oxidoreductase [Clostridiales Family XIII bacterium]